MIWVCVELVVSLYLQLQHILSVLVYDAITYNALVDDCSEAGGNNARRSAHLNFKYVRL